MPGRQRHHRPLGAYLAGLLDREEILIADLDLSAIRGPVRLRRNRPTPAPDVFTLLVNDEPRGVDYSCDITLEEEEWEE